MLIYGHDRELCFWAAQQLGFEHPICARDPVTIGVARGDKIVAAAVFTRYDPPSIEVTFVTTTPRWASRDNIHAILAYPFVQLGCKRVTAVTEECNAPARAFLERLGFQREGTHPDAFMSGAGISYGLLRKDAERWLARP